VNVAGPKPDPLGRASFATFAVSVLSIPIGVVSSVVIARALGPSAKGSFNLATTAASLTAMILGVSGTAGITLAVARGVASPRRLLGVLGGFATAQVPIAVVLLWAISASPLASAVLPVDRSPLMIGMIAVLVAATSALAYSRCVLLGLRQNVATSWRDLWGQTAAVFVIVAGLALGALLHQGPSPILILGLTIVGTLLAIVFMVQALLVIDLPRQGESGLRKVVGYASPLYAGNLVQFLNYRLDVFVVAAFAGVREVGLYALAVSLGQLLWIMSGSVATVLLPRVAASSPIEGARQAAQLTRITLLIGVAGAAALALIASPLVHVVYGQAYAEAVPMLLALLPGVVAFIAANVLAAYVVGFGRPRITLIVSLIGLCATLSLDFILIPRLGAVGAAIASTVSYSLSAVVIVRWAMKLARLPAREFLLVQRADLMVVGNALRRIMR
jgi:O-antigen/teichoic acid export membrane protein